MTRQSLTRAYVLGLGYGNVWLVSACAAFGILDAVLINTTPLGSILSILVVLLLGAALLYLCARFLRLGYTLPRSERPGMSKNGRRLFGGLVLLEIVGWSILDPLLATHNLYVWIVPIDLLIIGAHFIPLAFVFKVPAYLVMGILWLVAIVATMLILPSTTILGHISAWTTVPSLCCIVITYLTVLYLMTTEKNRFSTAAQVG